MKSYLLLLIIVALSSCSSFQRMRYSQLDKVPATPQEFQVRKQKGTVAFKREAEHLNDAGVLCTDVQPVADSFLSKEIKQAVLPEVVQVENSSRGEYSLARVETQNTPVTPIKRDWSLLIGCILIAGGIIALSMCIFVFPYSGMSFLWILAFELLTLLIAWKLIGTGVMYFITRFRSGNNFPEK